MKLVPANLILKRTWKSQFDSLKLEKTEADKNYKLLVSDYKINKKKLNEMRIEREKLRHPEWYNEKKINLEEDSVPSFRV
jgi:hypothetical protein